MRSETIIEMKIFAFFNVWFRLHLNSYVFSVIAKSNKCNSNNIK